jgi:predicted dehydrogenase
VEKVQVGVVGVGYLGQFHAEKYAKMDEVELVGVVDVDPSRAKEIAQRYLTQPFFHHTDLFSKVQAVSIAVPTHLHHNLTKDFLLQGVDVLLEKPIANTLEEADELIGLAESRGLILQVGHLERFNGAVLALEGIVQNPRFIESHRLGPFTGRGADVNVVLDLMIHDIDITLNWVDSEVKQIHAVGFPFITHHLDFANARIEFENGCIANLTASRVSMEKSRKTRVLQAGGILSIDYISQKVSFLERVTHAGRTGGSEMLERKISVKKIDPLETEIRSFLQCVRTRKQARVSGKDGRRALEFAFKIIQEISDSSSFER